MAIEIERKYTVKNNSYKDHAYAHKHIIQGYILSDKSRTVRVRISDNEAYLTIKGPSNDAGVSRFEWETALPLEDGKSLLRLCEYGFIEKVRYYVKYENHLFEIDEFKGTNHGLTIAEVELEKEDELIDLPDFIDKEVTGDKRYYNASLLTNPYKNWNHSPLMS